MTTNRLGKSAEPAEAKSPYELCEQANQIVARIGRRDVHWVVRNGHPVIEFKNPPTRGAMC